ncbi:hypothetical protein PC129_g3651 [Phytophthora cactorum]|uniref:Uncharacterized protein n=2 Tax=Phytophthora cactorum TaxID=29920 RepID=A0A8T1IN60_9STRA|nr:hypothetical protein PC117_g4914 [Phytophthora cactorum]KAG3225721.1 hypothetical protein PC129_g3651 [Phytophthora cactorum]KAG4059500.1 hypothetical protein PC123_g5552 [Phytophthora cactorum]
MAILGFPLRQRPGRCYHSSHSQTFQDLPEPQAFTFRLVRSLSVTMSNVNEPIRFGDVVKLQTKSAFVESAPSFLGFLELPGKAQTQLLVVPPVKDEAKDRFIEAEFIIAPIRGDKQQANGTPLTYQTPFVLRTSDGKDGSTYSLNNKVVGQREGVSLQVSATKGEMYIQVEKEGCTNATGLHYGDDGLNLRVVDSNRVRKTLNQLLTHAVKPKSDTPGGIVTCGAKGTSLTFSFQLSVDADGKAKTETTKYIKNPQARRGSMEALSPSKVDQLGRADRIDSSEFSDVDAMSRSSSIAGFGSNPASPRSSSMTSGLANPVDAAAVAARLPVVKDDEDHETEATVSTSSAATSSHESSPSAPANSAVNSKPADTKTPTATSASPSKPATVKTKAKASPAPSPVKTAAPPAASPVKAEVAKTEPVKSEPAKTEPVEADLKVKTAKTPATKAEPAKPVTTAATKAGSGEPKTVVADASTFPPTPAINGPAPAPVVLSPKAAASPKTTPKATATSTTVPASPKMIKQEDVAKLKAEAEVENLEPACGAKCSVM